jgi:hypothetical protein
MWNGNPIGQAVGYRQPTDLSRAQTRPDPTAFVKFVTTRDDTDFRLDDVSEDTPLTVHFCAETPSMRSLNGQSTAGLWEQHFLTAPLGTASARHNTSDSPLNRGGWPYAGP